ncbi:MAG: hypothetical protein ABW022_08230 [Actinoplanes sp.]
MGFMDRAWESAAEEYGKARAEKYGRIMKAWRTIQVLAGIGLGLGILYLWHLGQG